MPVFTEKSKVAPFNSCCIAAFKHKTKSTTRAIQEKCEEVFRPQSYKASIQTNKFNSVFDGNAPTGNYSSGTSSTSSITVRQRHVILRREILGSSGGKGVNFNDTSGWQPGPADTKPLRNF